MWRNPLIIAGGGAVTLTITSDTLIGNLHTFLGSPTGQQAINILIDGADVGDVQITTDFAAGSTFTFQCINGGRILGLGGDGGKGANRPVASNTYNSGNKGSPGGHAIDSQYDVNIDIDDGYLFGGGGGGGGGSAWYFSTYMFGGCGPVVVAAVGRDTLVAQEAHEATTDHLKHRLAPQATERRKASAAKAR